MKKTEKTPMWAKKEAKDIANTVNNTVKGLYGSAKDIIAAPVAIQQGHVDAITELTKVIIEQTEVSVNNTAAIVEAINSLGAKFAEQLIKIEQDKKVESARVEYERFEKEKVAMLEDTKLKKEWLESTKKKEITPANRLSYAMSNEPEKHKALDALCKEPGILPTNNQLLDVNNSKIELASTVEDIRKICANNTLGIIILDKTGAIMDANNNLQHPTHDAVVLALRKRSIYSLEKVRNNDILWKMNSKGVFFALVAVDNMDIIETRETSIIAKKFTLLTEVIAAGSMSKEAMEEGLILTKIVNMLGIFKPLDPKITDFFKLTVDKKATKRFSLLIGCDAAREDCLDAPLFPTQEIDKLFLDDVRIVSLKNMNK